MKTVRDKQILMAADFAGYPLKEAIREYLERKGWTVTDIGVKADSDPNDTELMFHRIGLRVGAMITEKEFERALIFCGTGMGIHIAASKCPGVHAGVVESVPAAFRAITGNGVNVLAMGAFYVTPELGKQCADAFLYNDFGSGWEWWPDFDKFHQIAIDELNAFDYATYKANGFKVNHLGDCHCELYDRPEGLSPAPLACKRTGRRILSLVGAILAMTTFASESVEWPADFDSKLSARIEAAKPSGLQCVASEALSGFDSVTHDDMIASIAELRNFIKPGFVLTFR